MSADEPASRPVLKVGLRRVELAELVAADAALSGCGWVRALGTALEALCAAAVVRRYGDSANVYTPGDGGGALFLVLRGEARLVVGRGENAVEVVAQKGDVFGEHEALGRAPVRRGSAIARGELDAAELPAAALNAALAQAPSFARYLQGVDAERRARCDELSDFLKRW